MKYFWVCILFSLVIFQNGYAQSPLDLLPTNEATHVVANSGNWTAASTWQGGDIPSNLAKVLIPSGMTLTVDSEISTRIKTIRIQGKLTFSTTANTALNVETIVQDVSGELEIGTMANPVSSNATCTITIIDEGNININSPQWEKGFVLLGKTTAYGAEKTSWLPVADNPSSGATSITLASAPSGWQVGDRIVITGVDPVDASSDELATIQSISGSTITLSSSLTKSHVPPATDLKVHVANLSRNIVITSESPTSNSGRDRGHIMFMHTLDVDFNYVRLHKMGRTRKDVQVDDWFINEEDDEEEEFITGPKTNIRGRYSIHFHRGGVNQSSSPAYVRGCAVEDDPGWAYVNHSAHVHFDNNVSYNVIGGGFQTESGDEVGSFTNNIAIRTVNPAYPLRLSAPENAPDTRESSQDFAFQGDGFWIHGGGVALSGNVASGCSGHGFIYWPEGLIELGFPTETYNNTYVPSNLGLSNNINISEPGVLATGWYPVQNFQNNEAYSATIGLATYYLHTTFFFDKADYDPAYIAGLHSTFDGFTAWNIDQQGIQLNYTERVTFKNIRLLNADGDNSTVGIWASHFRAQNKQIFEDIDIRGFGTGFALPSNGQVTLTCGTLINGTNFYIPSVKKNYRDMILHGLSTASDPAFSNPIDIRMDASFTNPDNKFPAYFLLPDKIILDYGSYSNQRLYFDEQAASYIPLPSDSEPYTIFDEERYILGQFATKSNQQLQNDYNMSFGGSLLPADAINDPGILGGKIRAWQNESMNVPKCIEAAADPDLEELNDCISSSSGNLVAATLPSYVHPTESNCLTTNVDSDLSLENDCPTLFPNPTTGLLRVKGDQSDYRLQVFSVTGALINTGANPISSTAVDLSELPPGVYFVKSIGNDSQNVCVEQVIKVQ